MNLYLHPDSKCIQFRFIWSRVSIPSSWTSFRFQSVHMQILCHCIHPRHLDGNAVRYLIRDTPCPDASTTYPWQYYRHGLIEMYPRDRIMTYSFTPYSNTSCCLVPGGNTLSKVKPSFSGPKLTCAERMWTVWRLSAKETTVSPPSRCSIALTGRNLGLTRKFGVKNAKHKTRLGMMHTDRRPWCW